jgi:hypothetical protein
MSHVQPVTTPAQTAAATGPSPEERLRLAQFDYAWKWFDYHADQRTKMFNYMLIAMSLFANAIVTSIDKNLCLVATALCVVSSIVAIIFARLDFRNQTLVRFGEDVLRQIETRWLFSDPMWRNPAAGIGNDYGYGILKQENPDHPKGVELAVHNFIAGKHRFCFRAIAWLMAILFLAGAIAISRHTITSQTQPPVRQLR